MIIIKNLSYDIPNAGSILSDINLEIDQGDFVGILGKNGAGKTTLIDLIMGFRIPTQGQIQVLGSEPVLSDRKEFREVAFLSQDVCLKDGITVKDFFNFHKAFYDNYSLDRQDSIISKFKIDLKSKIGSLSTGQKRRIQITAALASMPKILIVDEITAVLDPDARKIFFDYLVSINENHKTTVILATNIVEDLKGKVHKVFFIKDHKITTYGTEVIDDLFLGDD